VPTKLPAANLSQRIDTLLQERQQHADAIANIDHTLGQIGSLLGATANGHRPGGKRGRPAREMAAAGVIPTKRRKRRTFSVTATDLILSFVKEQKHPTSKEINAHWRSEGRSGTADNTLTLLVKGKKLKRTPLGEGIRGSRYSLA
jgi:rhodanese-related sulfurtransferase